MSTQTQNTTCIRRKARPSVTSNLDLRESEFVKSLVASRVLLVQWNFMSILLNDAVEGTVKQSVVSRRKRQIETACPQLFFQLGQIAPKDEEHFFQLREKPRLRF